MTLDSNNQSEESLVNRVRRWVKDVIIGVLIISIILVLGFFEIIDQQAIIAILAAVVGYMFGRAATREYIPDVSEAVQRLTRDEPIGVQETAARQIQILTEYYNAALSQAQRSFSLALIAAAVGLGFFLAAIGFIVFYNQEIRLPVISLISGALIEVISGINFYLYSKASSQLADFQVRLDMTQRYLLANSVCEGMEKNIKQIALLELVRAIASIDEIHVSGYSQASQTEKNNQAANN